MKLFSVCAISSATSFILPTTPVAPVGYDHTTGYDQTTGYDHTTGYDQPCGLYYHTAVYDYTTGYNLDDAEFGLPAENAENAENGLPPVIKKPGFWQKLCRFFSSLCLF